MNFYVVSDTTLTSLADAIRAKNGKTNELIFPEEFIEEIEVLSQDYESWNGNYSITPSVTSQILDTKSKIMRDNLIINEIPYSEVSNTSGGNTVHIGFNT